MPRSRKPITRGRNNVVVANDPLAVSGTISATIDAEKSEDAAHSSGDTGSFVLAVRNDGGSALAGTDGDYIPFTTDANGNLRTTADTELPAAAALTDNTANPTVPLVGSMPHWYDGATWDRATGDATNGLTVNLGTNNDVTVSGNVTVLNFGLEVGLGNITGYTKVNKFGAAPDCDQNVDTDIWDGADGTTSTDIWVAPTTARTHDIKSTDANDDGDPVGTGMRTIRVYGLTSWSSAETSEDVTLNGTSNVATSNSYVIIHRMVGLTFGSGGTNAGIITATAQTDATVTAAIQAGEGQTLMCIYGIPDTQTIHLFGMRADILRSVASTVADLKLLVKENADQSDSAFITKEKFQFGSAAPLERSYNPLKSFTGPCIIKMQTNAASNNSEVTAAFDAYVVDN